MQRLVVVKNYYFRGASRVVGFCLRHDHSCTCENDLLKNRPRAGFLVSGGQSPHRENCPFSCHFQRDPINSVIGQFEVEQKRESLWGSPRCVMTIITVWVKYLQAETLDLSHIIWSELAG